MDSRAYWFGAALALAILLFWREMKEGQANNYYGSGTGYSGGYPGTSTTTGLPGVNAGVGAGCGCCSSTEKIFEPFPSPSVPNPSAPASMSSFGNNRTAAPSSLQRTYINAYGFRVPVGAGN